eukprot:CAMPEP_0172360234 /NCGR_PEP_ID=MMETSP1060-20121228/4308_1 /TAXON_ID=37318 /ORGANISM="Pseudo-nitzschia pungens, Strain cf. cingulata" /LENGTH=957 /DNA_ID=CAMNT_0013082181 /DNA_START=260 /DNA_END=3130 /DNA_ORIENTATION=-
MIATQTRIREERPSTPIISNRSPGKEPSETIDPVPFARHGGGENDSSGASSTRQLHETNAPRSRRGMCDSLDSGSDSSPAMPRGRVPKFSSPDEEPIVLPRSAIAPQRARLIPKNSEGIEAGGNGRGGRNRNRRRRPLLFLSSWKFSLLFPTASDSDSGSNSSSSSSNRSKNSQGPLSNTLFTTAKGSRRSNGNGNGNGNSDENNTELISKHNDRTMNNGVADVNLLFALVFEFFRSGMPLKLVRQIGSTGPSWLLPATFRGNHKSQSRFPSQALVVSHDQRLQLQRQRRRRSAQKRRKQPVCISGLPNQGQTCFLNSVLQSLASLEPFLEYLEGIVQFQEEMDHVSSSASLVSDPSDGTLDGYGRLFFSNHPKGPGNSSARDTTFSKQLLDLLKGINYLEGGDEEDENVVDDEILVDGERRLVSTGFQSFWGQRIGVRRGRRRRKRLDPKTLLRRIAKRNQQFSSYGMYEQQDAQELFASLMEVVIHDSELDASPSDRRLEAVSDDGDEHNIVSLSDLLVQIGNEQDRFAEESSGDSLSLIMANKSCITEKDYDRSFPEEEEEEKKQDHNEHTGTTTTFATPPRREETKCNGLTKLSSASNGLATSYPRPNPVDGTKMMRSIMSPITPSPLSGWLGSTLRCSKCKHVRPIQNAPFLDIPLVPTSVPNYLSQAYGSSAKPVSPNASPMPSCSLDECLKNFTSVERVQDVECRSCTIQDEIANLEEEAMMLRGAVETTERRISKKLGEKQKRTDEPEPLEETKYLRDDLLKAEKRLLQLKTMDPDEDDIDPSLSSFERHDDSTYLFGSGSLDQDEKMPLQRCEAKKCLLLTRSPSILCCHVQRRYYDPFTNRMEKCVQFVEFPLFLDLSPYCAYGQKAIIPWAAGSRKEDGAETKRHQSPWKNDNNRSGKMPYRLQSVIEHRGNAYGGHYVAYRRDHSGTWFCVSDSRVTPVSWRNVQ